MNEVGRTRASRRRHGSALLAPAGTPAPVIAKLHQEAVKMRARIRTWWRVTARSASTWWPIRRTRSPTIIRNDTAKWAKVIKDAGIKTGE